MKVMGTHLLAAFLLSLFPVMAHTQDFSADVEYMGTARLDASSKSTATSPSHSSKIYVSKNQIRLETNGLTGAILLVNGEDHTAVALFPPQKGYQQLASAPSEYFRVADPENACRDWEKASDQKIVCEKVGSESIEGRSAVKYHNKRATEDTTAVVWIDLALKFVIRWEGANTGAELRNIKEAPQSADLFTVPSAYGVLRPQKPGKGFSKRSQ
jgi:hypothetical protein